MITILLIKVSSLSKLNSKELSNIHILGNYEKPTSPRYFKTLLESTTIDWQEIYLLPRKATINKKYHSFQDIFLSNILYLNKILFKFGTIKSPLCSFCKSVEETIIHSFSECLYAQYISNQTQTLFSAYINIPDGTSHSAILGFRDISIEHFFYY